MSLRCPKCPLKFATLTELTEHMRHELNSTGYQYQCSECGKAFQSRAHLKQHQWHHKEEKQFSCPDCKQEFKREDYINEAPRMRSSKQLRKRTANVAKIKDVDTRGNPRSTQQGSGSRGIRAGTLSEPGCHQNIKGTDPPPVELYALTSVKIEDNGLSLEQEPAIKSEVDPLIALFNAGCAVN